MSIIKENILLVLSVTFGLLAFGFLLFFSFSESSRIEELESDLKKEFIQRESIKEELSAFQNLEADFKQAERDLLGMAELEKSQAAFWKSILNPRENQMLKWSEKSPESVNADITRMFTSLRSRCLAAQVSLPVDSSSTPSIGFGDSNSKPKITFGFGFKAYDGFWPSFSKEEAKIIGIQSKIVKELVEYITQSAIESRPMSIVEILRESAGKIDSTHIGKDEIKLGTQESMLLRQDSKIKSLIFNIRLKAQSAHARIFINQLRPPFMLRDFFVERKIEELKIKPPTIDFTPNPFGGPVTNPVASKPVPIVNDVDSEFSFLIEYITEISNDLKSLHQQDALWEEANKEIYSEFLKKSGNADFIDEAMEILSDSE